MKFLRRSSFLITSISASSLLAVDYNFYNGFYQPGNGAPWTNGTTWTAIGSPVPTPGVPDLTSTCYVLPQDADGNYVFLINSPSCQAKAFYIPATPDNIGIQINDGIESGYSPNKLQLNPLGQDALYFNNTPLLTSDESEIPFEYCNLEFVSSGTIHNAMGAFNDTYGAPVLSNLDFQNYTCIYGNGINLEFLYEPNTNTNLLNQTIIGSDSSGNNVAASLNFQGLLGTTTSISNSYIGNKVPLITINSNLTLALNSQLAVAAGNLNFQGGNIITDIASFIGPATLNMTGGVLSNSGITTLGSFASGAYQPSTSQFTSGTIVGTGNLYFAGDANINIPITQGNFYLGQGLNPSTMNTYLTTPSTLTLNGGVLSGLVNINQVGTLTGNGLINGAVFSSGIIANNNIAIGVPSPLANTLCFSSGVTLTAGKLGVGASSLSVLSNFLASDATSVIGPAPLSLSGGAINNNGSITIGLFSSGVFNPSSSTVSSQLLGSGNLFVAGDALISGSVSQNLITIGQGLDLNQNPVNYPAGVNLLGSLIGTVNILSQGSCVGSGIITGNIQNAGSINPSNLVIGNDTLTSYLDLNASSINSTGVIGSATNQIVFAGGNFSQSAGASFGYKATQLTTGSGQITSDPTSLIGPCPVNMQGGQIINNGQLCLGLYSGPGFVNSSSNLKTGSLIGSGDLYIAGTVNVAKGFTLSQGQIFVGEGLTGFSATVSASGALIVNGTFNGAITLGPLGTVSGVSGYATGTFTNNGAISSPNIAIGYAAPVSGCLTLSPLYPIVNNGVIGSASTFITIGGGLLDSSPNSSIGTNASNVVIQNGTINLQGANFGFGATKISMTGGTVQMTASSLFGLEAGLFQMNGGYIQSDASSIVGPFPLNLQNGELNLAGTATFGLVQGSLFVPSNSTITQGTLTSLGSIYFAGNTLLNGTIVTDGIVIGEGYNPNISSLQNATCTFTVASTLQSDILNQISGSLSGNKGLVLGTLTNYGKVNPVSIYFGTTSVQNASITLAPYDVSNLAGGQIGYGSKSVTVIEGQIFNNQSYFGGNNLNQNIALLGGTINNINQGTFAALGGYLNVAGGYFNNDNTSTVGPVSLIQSGGQIGNTGKFILGNSSFLGSNLSSGTFFGGGDLYVFGTASLKTNVNQNNVIVGTVSQAGNLFNYGSLSAKVVVNQNGALLGNGTISGDLDVYGILSPGTSLNTLGSMTITQDLTLDAGSETQFYFGPNFQYTKISSENLYVNGSPTLFIEKQKQSSYTGIQTFTNILSFVETDSHVKDFIIQSPYKATLQENPSGYGYDITIEFSGLNPYEFPGNAGVVARNLDLLDGNTNLDLQDDIDVILRLNYDDQLATLLQLCPQFKLIQYGLEKLLFAQSDLFKIN